MHVQGRLNVKNFLFGAGLLAGLAIGAIVISSTGSTAPFNSVETTKADAGFVNGFCIFRDQLADGGVRLSFQASMDLPKVRTLPDAGTRTVIQQVASERCALGGAARTAAENFASGPATSCVLSSFDLEQ